MVFACSSCNASLKKAQIKTHSCNAIFCCYTCNAEFNKSNYHSHDICISEAEKYMGSDFKSNGNETKGMDRQKNWNNIAKEALTMHVTKDIKLKSVIGVLKSQANIPQKEKKFMNMINTLPQCKSVPNCGKLLWEIISNKKINLNQNKSVEDNLINNTEVKVEIKEDSSTKKRKIEELSENKDDEVQVKKIKTENDSNKSKEIKKSKKKQNVVETMEIDESNGKENQVEKIKKKKSKELVKESKEKEKEVVEEVKKKSKKNKDRKGVETMEVVQEKEKPVETETKEKKKSKKKNKKAEIVKATEETPKPVVPNESDVKASKKEEKKKSKGKKPLELTKEPINADGVKKKKKN